MFSLRLVIGGAATNAQAQKGTRNRRTDTKRPFVAFLKALSSLCLTARPAEARRGAFGAPPGPFLVEI